MALVDRGNVGAISYSTPQPHSRHLSYNQQSGDHSHLAASYSTPVLSSGSSFYTPESHDLGTPFGGGANYTPSRSNAGRLRPSGLTIQTPPNRHGKAPELRQPLTPRSAAAIRVHQYFPDNGEAGVPVTILATISLPWAQQVGLELSDGRVAGAQLAQAGSRLTVLFGDAEVDTKVERSLSTTDVLFGDSEVDSKGERTQSAVEDNPESSIGGLANLSEDANTMGSRSIDVTVTAFAPSFASTRWTNTRVPVRIRLVGPDIDPTQNSLSGGGVDVGEWIFWLGKYPVAGSAADGSAFPGRKLSALSCFGLRPTVSPRSALKRMGEPLDAPQRNGSPPEHPAQLRRPASFPALSSSTYGALHGGASRAHTISRNTAARKGNMGHLGSSTVPGASLGGGQGAVAEPFAFGGVSGYQDPNRQRPSSQHRTSMSISSVANHPETPTQCESVSRDRSSGDFSWSVHDQAGGLQSGFGSAGSSSRPTSMAGVQPYPASSPSKQHMMLGNPGYDLEGRRYSLTSNATMHSPLGTPAHPGAGYGDAESSISMSSGPNGLPQLMRASQIGANSSMLPDPVYSPPQPHGSARASLELHGNLNDMSIGWSHDEWRGGRRLVQFWRRQEGTVIHATFRPILPSQYVPNSIVISCIFREDRNECFVTSVDAIYLLEALVASRFTVEEKNRIRRNLEGFRPMTVSKNKKECERFFKLIMGFPNPKPRNIEKDVKVFPWKVLGSALKKIIGKYSASYEVPVQAPSGGPAAPSVTLANNHNRSGSDGSSKTSTPPNQRDARLPEISNETGPSVMLQTSYEPQPMHLQSYAQQQQQQLRSDDAGNMGPSADSLRRESFDFSDFFSGGPLHSTEGLGAQSLGGSGPYGHMASQQGGAGAPSFDQSADAGQLQHHQHLSAPGMDSMDPSTVFGLGHRRLRGLSNSTLAAATGYAPPRRNP